MRITVGKRLGIGFGILIILTLVIFLLTYFTVHDSKKINDDITQVYVPSLLSVERLNDVTVESKRLIEKWVNTYKTDVPEKDSLRVLIREHYPEVKVKIRELEVFWEENEKQEIDSVFILMDSLFDYHEGIMSQLSSFDNYEDPMVIFMVTPLVDETGEVTHITNQLLTTLSEIISRRQALMDKVVTEMQSSFSTLQLVVINSGILLVLGGMLIAFFTTGAIVKPVQSIKHMLESMGKGVIPEESIPDRNDEIGDMSKAMGVMIDGLERTIKFSEEIGSGNFDADYMPLSVEDSLGLTLLKMRDELAESERILEQKVEQRTAEVVLQKKEIESKNDKLGELYEQITDSIRYAKRIQEAILPPDVMVKRILKDSFVLYRPKDIVSGDFYWIAKKNDKALFSAVDCTGHGVPGAFMSIVGYDQLKHILSVIDEPVPGTILDMLNKGVTETLRQTSDGNENTAKDGMDLAFCALDFKTRELQFAGAYNPCYIIRNGEIIQIKGDKFPIGIFIGEEKKSFTNHTVQLEKGDVIYVFSDGFVDQFGGERGKKLMAKRFKTWLLELCDRPMDEQKEELNKRLEDWMGDTEQVDDILVMGVKIN